MLVEIFKPIIENLSSAKLEFSFGDDAFQNVESDYKAVKNKYKANEAINMFWLNNEWNYNISSLKTPAKELVFNVECVLAFKSELDWLPEQRYPSISTAIAVQKEIIEALINNSAIQNVGGNGVQNINVRTVYNLFDANYDCYVMTFALKLKDIQPRCAY